MFGNGNLIVEKFLPGMDGDDYLVRYCYFFGDRDMNIILKSKRKIVNEATAFHIGEAPAQPELHSIRRRLGFDCGKFDYVLRDGRVMLLDVNRTPTLGTSRLIEKKAARWLAGGIWPLLERRAQK